MVFKLLSEESEPLSTLSLWESLSELYSVKVKINTVGKREALSGRKAEVAGKEEASAMLLNEAKA